MKDYLDANRYTLTDNETGEIMYVDSIAKEADKRYWEKTYAKTIAECFELVGNAPTKVLAHFLRIKDSNNQINGTVREMAKDMEVSKTTVTRVMSVLTEAGFMKKRRSGCYMLSPDVIKHGSRGKGIMVLMLWKGL
ncbi:hypothetical protein HN803_02420 [candidate division WWE3 bacterium]|nr:hypothetical protein [candidate division WWE3 bacterium]